MSNCNSQLITKDEIDLLKSAFEELTDIAIREDENSSFKFQVKVNLDKEMWIKLKLLISFSKEGIKGNCDVTLTAFPLNLFTVDFLSEVKAEIFTSCETRQEDFSSAVLFEICNILVNCKEKINQISHSKKNKQVKFLLFIDHMNDFKRYSGHLCSWMQTQNLEFVSLMSVENKPHYFVLLAGDENNCKSFVQKIRTTKGVDVNSIKNPCKERKMKVLFEGECGDSSMVNSFEIEKFASYEHMKDYFFKLNLVVLYDNFIGY